jgi:hypothetical protein
MQDHDEDDELLLEFDSEASGRTAVIADEGDSVWLYLTHPTEPEIERDCWLFNLPTAAAEPDPEMYAAQSAPPPAPARFITPEGTQQMPDAARIRVHWSQDGHSVAVLLDGVAIGVASIELEHGYSRYLREAGPWGLPWDEAGVHVLVGDGA